MEMFLVTGATGFLGTHLVKRLLEKNYRVIGISRKRGSVELQDEIFAKKNFVFYKADLKKPFNLPQKIRIDGIFHLASQLNYSKNVEFTDYYDSNVTTTRHVIEFAKRNDVKCIVYTSTCSVFGKQPKEKYINENTITIPTTYYGVTKYLAERLLDIETGPTPIQTVVCRYTSIFGRNNVYGIVYTLHKLAQQNKDIELFCNGERCWNLLHVSDAVDVLLKIMTKRDQFKKYDELIVGGMESISSLELAKKIGALGNSSSRIIPVNRRSPSDWDVFIDITKARTILNFQPMTISEGLRQYIGEVS
jgi:nucleoside-diphosphate-sugar epimerase